MLLPWFRLTGSLVAAILVLQIRDFLQSSTKYIETFRIHSPFPLFQCWKGVMEINEIQRGTKSVTVSLIVKFQHTSTFNNVLVQNNIENGGGVFVSNILWTMVSSVLPSDEWSSIFQISVIWSCDSVAMFGHVWSRCGHVTSGSSFVHKSTIKTMTNREFFIFYN